MIIQDTCGHHYLNRKEKRLTSSNVQESDGERNRNTHTKLQNGRGGEFVSHEFNQYCNDSGIERYLTAPYTPQENGVVERRNRTMMEMARSIMKHMGVPNYLWG